MEISLLVQFLQQQSALADAKSRSYIHHSEQWRLPQRTIFAKLNQYMGKFLWWNPAYRWITLTWLRGSGKTTLLFQLYWEVNSAEYIKLFLSLDRTHGVLGVNLNEVLSALEIILGKPFELLEKPVLLFLDEVQYDPTWWITLKTLYDRTDKVFIFSTGSAALMLNTNADIARRTIFAKMHPLSFTEYLKISQKKPLIEDLWLKIEQSIFQSQSAQEVYENILTLSYEINTYYMGVMQSTYKKYLWHGSLPHMVAHEEESIVYEQIQSTLDKIIHSDLSMSKFSSDTVTTIPSILYALSDMDSCNVTKMAEKMGMSRQKLESILETLESAELLRRIYPQGSHLNQVITKKPSKYLFAAPAFRAMHFRLISNIISDEQVKWKITEDLIAMYITRIFDKTSIWSLTYDNAQWGADFILTLGNKRIIIEVGSGSKGYKQVIQTMKKVDAQYGIVISEDELELNEAENIVKIPLRTFLLM
jgi:uncharacterized protein